MIEDLKCPDEFTLEFGRALVACLGGDLTPIESDWCWIEFGRQYHELLEPAMRYFERATTGNPAKAGYRLARDCDAPVSWAQRVIENATTGDSAWYAYRLACDCHAPADWAQRAIENAATGDPAWAAHWLARDCSAPADWAIRVCRKHGRHDLVRDLEALNT